MPTIDPGRAGLADLRDSFERAASRHAVEQIDLRVAGVGIRVLVIGDVLTGHIRRGVRPASVPAEPTVTIRVFDSASTGVRVPAPHWPLDAYAARDEIIGSGRDGVDAACDVIRRVVSLYDPSTREGIWWSADAERLAPWDPGAPLRNVVHWALRDHGFQLAHGAAIGLGGSGVLLTARGGSGKSTTSLSLVEAGWQYVADDYCLLAATGPPTAHAIYRLAKADASTLMRFPHLTTAILNPDRNPGEKAIIDLQRCIPDRLVDRLALRAVVIPHLDPTCSVPHLSPVSAVEAGRALIPSTVLQLPGCDASTPVRLAAGIGGLPAYELHLPDDLGAVPRLLAELLESLDASPERVAP